MSNKSAAICFFIGTEAELIKIFPVILEIIQRNVEYRIISSGQNDISDSGVLKAIKDGKIDALLSDHSTIKTTAFGLMHWFFITSKNAVRKIRDQLSDIDFPQSILVVHGDTLSTVLGARLGVNLRMKVAHVEAGLRSYDFFNPFPEEIDRVITSHYATLHFSPGGEAINNLNNVKGEKVNTIFNTILDSLKFSYSQPPRSLDCNKTPEDYFVFVIHRQENLANRDLLKGIVDKVIRLSTQIRCVMIMHKPTEASLQELGLLRKLIQTPTISIKPRMDYFDFMKLITDAQFVISDGGSNQEELSYLGKPCLLIRQKTERNDGIGRNVVLYAGDIGKIDEFALNYHAYEYPRKLSDISPSKIIADKLVSYLK